jgi:hypothetical protein
MVSFLAYFQFSLLYSGFQKDPVIRIGGATIDQKIATGGSISTTPNTDYLKPLFPKNKKAPIWGFFYG